MEIIKHSYKDKSAGFNKSINIKREDVDFFLAVIEWCKRNDETLSGVISSALKMYFIASKDLFPEFTEILIDVTGQNLEDTWVLYLGERRKLKDILKEDTFTVKSVIRI